MSQEFYFPQPADDEIDFIPSSHVRRRTYHVTVAPGDPHYRRCDGGTSNEPYACFFCGSRRLHYKDYCEECYHQFIETKGRPV